MKKLIITALTGLLLLAPFLLTGCVTAKNTQEGLAIYLTKNSISPDKMEMLSHIETTENPAIGQDDIVSYIWETHTIHLKQAVFNKLEDMQIPTTGVSFVVCVDEAPIYWGAFWAGYSSQSFDGVTIQLKPSMAGENRVQITTGYPGGSFFKGEDPRANPLIKEALEKAGKLE